MANKESDAQEYLKKHKIMELFENLTAQLIYERPEDPKAYMKQFLEKLKDARTVQRNYPCIFDDSNVRSLFGMLDVTGKGFITYEQYKQVSRLSLTTSLRTQTYFQPKKPDALADYPQQAYSLETLGVKKFDRDPPGGDVDRISAEVFLKEARQGLAQASATFSVI